MATVEELRQRVREMQYIEGYLISGPTSMALPFPYGGTTLGLWGEMHLVIDPSRTKLTAVDDWGGQVYEVIEPSLGIVLGAQLREPANAALSAIFPYATTPSTTGKTRVPWTATSQRYLKGSDRAVKLLLAPVNTEVELAVILYAAAPLVEETADVAFSMEKAWGLPALFEALPDASLRIGSIDYVEALVL